MSKSSKTRASLENKRKKQARKAANQTMYQQRRDDGQNNKSKRFTLNQRRKYGNPGHPHDTYCGNIGCKECFPHTTMSFTKTTKSFAKAPRTGKERYQRRVGQ